MGSTQQILFPEEYLCRCADEFISCKTKQYMNYYKYKVGSKPDIKMILKVDRIRRIICDNICGLSDCELNIVREKLNKLLME